MHESDNILNISYPNGRMCLDLERFFPAPIGKLRKLFSKVVDQVIERDEKVKIAARVKDHLQDQIRESEDEDTLRSFANAAVKAHTKAGEIKLDVDKQAEIVDRMKQKVKEVSPRDKAAAKAKLKEEKEKLSALKFSHSNAIGNYRCYKNEFEARKSRSEKLKKNLEIVEEFYESWT